MNQPLFSIIIPTYNRAHLIEKTIQSFLAQTYENFEIIIVDDGSTDNTEQVLKAIKDDRIFYYKKENAERGAARNFGTQKAKGYYLNFFDSDDIAYPNHLQEAVEIIQEKSEPEVFALDYDIKDEKGKIIRHHTDFKDINKQLIQGNLLSCDGIFLKKEIACNYPFSEMRELSGSEDYFLWLQIAARYKIYHNNIPTSAIIEHDERSVLSMDKDNLIKRKELMLKIVLTDGAIANYYGNKIKYIQSNTYSYLSLHLAMLKCKKESWQYFKKTVHYDLSFSFQKRFLAILKYLIFK